MFCEGTVIFKIFGLAVFCFKNQKVCCFCVYPPKMSPASEPTEQFAGLSDGFQKGYYVNFGFVI